MLFACMYCSNKTYDGQSRNATRTRWLPNDNDTFECRREDPLHKSIQNNKSVIAFAMFDAQQ